MARVIILGYDGSDCAKDALDVAVDLARDDIRSRIVVVIGHAVHKAWGGLSIRSDVVSPPNATELESLKRDAQASIAPLLEEARALIAAAGVTVETTLKWESPSTALLDVAEKQDADVIVVGSHGTDAKSRLSGRVLLGSTPSRLLHQTHVPVLVVPHGR